MKFALLLALASLCITSTLWLITTPPFEDLGTALFFLSSLFGYTTLLGKLPFFKDI